MSVTGQSNVIDMVSRANIKIPAPCYRTKRIKACCGVCAVEIDGEQQFACSTVPQHGMNIIVCRDDLKAIRKQRLLEYKELLAKVLSSKNPKLRNIDGKLRSGYHDILVCFLVAS